MFATNATDAALLITALAGGVVAVSTAAATVIGALSQARRDRVLDRKVNVIHEGVQQANTELRTLNGQSVGQLADADETRRIEAIPLADRTTADDEHVEAVPPLGG